MSGSTVGWAPRAVAVALVMLGALAALAVAGAGGGAARIGSHSGMSR